MISNYIPDEIDGLLTAATVRVLRGLLHFRNRASGKCCPRMSTVGAFLHLTDRTIQKHVSRLQKLGIVRSVRGRYSNQYEFAPTDQWTPLIRSRCSHSSYPTGTKLRISPEQTFRSGPPASLYEPSVYEPSVLNPNADAAASITVLAEPASPVGGAAAVPVKEKTAEQTPTKPPAEAHRQANIPHRHTIPPIATPEAILRGIEPELAKLIRRTFRRLIEDYPSPGLPLKGLEVLARMMTEADDPPRLAKRLENSCSRWQDRWGSKSFKPQLWRWLASGDWQFPPKARR